MTTPTNGVHEFPADAQGIVPASESQTRPLYWSIRRELWEHRYLLIGPMIVTAIVLFATLATLAAGPGRIKRIAPSDTAKQYAVIEKPMRMAPAPIMFATFLIGFFYSLDALFGERRDRSILFWKSLPVSDKTIVLSKASIPMAVLPLTGLALSILTTVVLGMWGTAMMLVSGLNPVAFWIEFEFFESVLVMVYGLGVHTLWFAPIFAWFMLVSAWAKRAPFLWAMLPVFAAAAVERILFNTTLFLSLVGYRFIGAMKEAFVLRRGSEHSIDRITQLDPLRFFTRPGLWLGLALAVAFLTLAIRIRRYREPI